MASPSTTIIPTFSDFFDCWLAQQDRDLQALQAAVSASSAHHHHHHQQHDQNEAAADSQTRHLVDQVIGHYEYYYGAKSALACRDGLPMFTPTWTSSTDNLFLWVAGWRPSTAFHLLYSKSGLQLQGHLASYFSLGLPPQDLGDLSHAQLERIDTLQRETIRMETDISEEEAETQESVASSRLVDISHAMSQAPRTSMEDGGLLESAMEADMKGRREKMSRVLARADELRLGTLKRVVEILRPMQAVHFLIAASEMLLQAHGFGKSMDRGHGRSTPPNHQQRAAGETQENFEVMAASLFC